MEVEEEISEPPVGVAKVAQRKKRGRRTRGRKKPVKKKLQKIVEEPEEVVDKDSVVEEESKTKMETEDESKEKIEKEDESLVKEENEEVAVKEANEDVVSKEEESPKLEKDVERVEELGDAKDNDDKKDDKTKRSSPLPDGQPSKMETEEKETKELAIKEESKEEETTKSEIKEEPEEEKTALAEVEEGGTLGTTQRFTVSQLLQKLAPTGEAEESLPASEIPSTVEPESKSIVPDPDRASYDPYFFELIISSVEELQEWINRFTDPNEEDKPRPRCEIKLREHLQSLLEEAQPLASDQQQANQKISQQLWKEWERFRCSSSNPRQSADVAEQSYHNEDSGASESDGTDPEDGSAGSDDGVRHSRRLRVKRNLHTVNGSHQSTRSSSPMDEEPATKQNRKSSYNFDPSWDSDPNSTPETPVGRKRSNYVPEMKNPGFWIGRRVTRATAEFVGVPEESASPPQQPQNSQPVTTSTIEKSPPPGVQSGQLADQLRQLRRQQALLSSNDPRPGGSSVSSPNGSPAIYFPSKDGQLIRITNPKAAGFLTQLKVNRPLQSAPSPIAAQPRRILIQQRPPQHLQKPDGSPVAPVSIDITQLVTQAVQSGLIVTHEPRSLSFDMGHHGHFMVTAQMTPAGPKVISASPLPRKVKIVTNVPVPESIPPVLTSPDPASEVPAVPESISACPAVSESVPAVPTELNPPTSVAHELNPPVVLASTGPTTIATDMTTPIESTPPAVTPSLVTPAITPKANGSPAVSKQILITDPRQSNIISADILRSVAGPEAVGARLTIVKEGNAKMLTLILSNGEIRRLTNSQVQQIQAAVRNKTKPSTDEAATS
jgi:hypothetical protein